jgi:hypothetical protein
LGSKFSSKVTNIKGRVFRFFVSIWLYDFLANKIDWLKSKVFANIDEKAHFRMWLDGTNYCVQMVLILAIFRQLIALKGLWKVFENKAEKIFESLWKKFFWSWRLRTLSRYTNYVIRQTTNARQRKILRYQAIKSKLICYFKTEIHNYSFDARKKIWNETFNKNFAKKVRTCRLPFPETWSFKNSLITICC